MVNNSQKQEKPQDFKDFELIKLLFQEMTSAGSDPVDLLDKSFKVRFQSLVDQIQSYLHSSEKAGFFPHRFLAWFSSVLDTKLNNKLGIKELHFRFEGARTLKIVAETESKVHVFIFTEDIEAQHFNSPLTYTRNFEFTTGEWKDVMGRDYTPLDERKLQIDLIKILKDKYKLVKSRPKSDKDVKSKELYLYLKNNVLECKAKDVHGRIQTIQIGRDELKGNDAFKNKFFDEVKQFLGRSGKDLSDSVRKELSRITSAKGYTLKSDEEGEKINIEVERNKKIKNEPITPTAEFPFQEVTKKLNKKNSEGNPIYLEDYIGKLANPDVHIDQVQDNLKEILTYIKEVHTNLNLQDNVYGNKAREADQHGFVVGVFDNFRYRDNTKIYLEQFAGGGYADIVLLVRGSNRAIDSVPILIELKAGTKGQVTPSDALKQAKDYVKGFRPNKMRVLTNTGDVIAVGLNLDFKKPFEIKEEPIKQPPSPLMERILTDIHDWDGTQQNGAQLEEQIKSALSSEYHTFPANKETKDHYYFSRYILGESILINEIGQDKNNIKKYIYSYDEYPLNWPQGTEYTLSKSPVMTLIFIQGNEGQEKTAFIFHIRESNTKEFYADKKIPVLDIPEVGEIGNVIETKMSLKKYETGLSFEELFEIERISKYKPGNTDQKFTGNFLKIPNSDELKAEFSHAIASQHADSSNSKASLQAYKELLTKVADAIYPIKDLITNEARLQAVLNGLFSSYSDLKLQETSAEQDASAKIVIIPEFQVGAGGRVDMVIQGIGPSPHGTKEYTPIALEFKLIDKNLNQDQLKQEVDKLTKEQNIRYAKGAALKTITDSDKMLFMGVVVNVKAKDKNSLILASDEFVPAMVVHSSIDIAKRKHLQEIQEVTQIFKNMGIREDNLRTLEFATAEKSYHYWLHQHDIADVARIKYGYGTDEANTLFEIVGSPEHIVNQLQQFQDSVTTRGERRPLTLIVNLDNNHWVTLVISHQNGQYNGYYVDSLGNNIPDNIRQVLQQAQVTVNDVSFTQQRDGYNCGLWALENARDINAVLQGNRLRNIPDEIRSNLQIRVRERNEDYFIHMREDVSNALSVDPQRIANLEAVLAETQQPRFDLNNCVKQGNRRKRSTNSCSFSKDDVEKLSRGKVDENNVDKIIIDSDKFLTYVKSNQNEKKNAQLIEFIGDKSIEGDRKYSLDKVIEDRGYERYVQNERVKDLYSDVSQQTGSSTKNSKLKGRLMNAAGGIQLIRGIHGAIVSCKDGTATDCGLNLGGIAWSFASQPIENVMVKITPKVVASAEKVAGKIVSGTLGKQTKFAIRIAGVKFGSTIAKGIAGAISGVFDIVDIGMSASNLVDCKKRENSNNPCGEKEIRDNIASISFSTVSFVSGIALTALGMPVVGIAVGVGLMVGYGIYSGVSNIVEYEKKYDTTHDENWRIFWHTFAFQPMPQDVQHLAARKEIVNNLAEGVLQALDNSPNVVVAYGVGLGKVSGNTLRSDYATIMMNRKNANTRNLSRVIPSYTEGASRICLPQITNQDYEKGIKSSVPSAQYYCENAIVISQDKKVNMMQKNRTIVYDLSNVDRGVIAGSNEWNNNFLIGSGTVEVTGGSNRVANRFIVNDVDFSGKIIGGNNSVNILDLSQLKDTVVGVNFNYRFKPNASGSLKARVNGHWLIDDQIDNSGIFNYYYVGRKNKVDEVLCMGYFEHLTGIDDRDVIIDSSGGSNNNEKDVVENCKKVIISPYTTVKGEKSNYTFYVKTADYKGRGLYSEIDVDGTGTVVFPEIDLLGDCDQIVYSKNSNTLSLKINLGQNNKFTFNIKNYVEQSSNKPHFALIDKNGSNIVPKIEKSDSPTIEIKSFELHSEHSLDNFKDVENHYKKILKNNKDYKVFSVIRDKVQNQDNGVVPHTVFGSLEDDIINFDQGTMFARGGEGSDVYIIGNGVDGREVKIDNNSNDKKLDTLFMSTVEEDFSIQQCDLYLKHNNSNIQVKNYLQNPNYRHLIIMNKKGETFIPNIQSMSCSSLEKGKLVPFLQATQTQNMFLLSKDFKDDHVVIDSRLEDIEKYKDKDDLLLIRESEIPFMIRIEGFYTERSKWENISYSLWNNDHLSPSSGLLKNVDDVTEYKDKLRGNYERIVKEYVIDFTQSVSIAHNQNDTLTLVGQDEERVGVVILKNITPDRIKISSNDTDLVFFDKVSNHTINIKSWNSNESYRISTLEFDLGLEPITIRRLDRFSLSETGKIQSLIEKVSENYKNKSKYAFKVENDFKCLVSIDNFMRENKNPIYQCLGFSSLQDHVGFTENSCSLEQIEELKDKMPSSSQILTLLEKSEIDLLLNGYGSNVIDQCNKLMITLGLGVLKPLVSTAVHEGKWDEVKILLDKTAKKSNADAEHKNQCSQNWTPLHYAVYNGNVELSESLFKKFLEEKGNINALDSASCDNDNLALLHYAVHYGNLDMVGFLIDKGANVEIRSKKGKTSLHLAVEEAKQNIIKLLLDRGANIEAKNNDGRIPLYLAAYNNDSGIIELLCNRIKAKSNDAFKMIKQIKILKQEVVNQANIPSEAKRLVESCISDLRDSIKNAAKKVLKDGILNNSNASNIKLTNEVYNFDKKLFGEAIKEAVSDTYASVGIEGILRFIRSHYYIGQFISGYIAVFNKIPKNNSAIVALAYSIKEVTEMNNYSKVSSEEKDDLERLKNKLPKSVKNLVFLSKVCFKDIRINEYLCATEYTYDSDRRRVSTYPSKGGDECRWLIERSGNNVHIKNDYYGEYLYSASNDYNYDLDRRRVFTWIPKNKVYSGWKIEPSNDKVYIKDNSGEFLYSSDLYDGHNYGIIDYGAPDLSTMARGVFTWIPKGKFYIYDGWRVEDCSRSRKRRDITSLDMSIGTGDNKSNVSLNRQLPDIEMTNNATRPIYLKLKDDTNQHIIVEDAENSLQVVDYKSILTEENGQQIVNRVSAIAEDVERHTFLNQSKNKLDFDSYLNNKGKVNTDLYLDFMKKDICSELNTSERRNIILGRNDVCIITSGHEILDIENFPIQEVVINDDIDGKKSLRSTLDLRQLMQQVDRDLSIKSIPMVIEDESDLLIKLSISAIGLQQDVITVRLKDALINKWYKKLQIIFDNAQVEIDNSLDLKSSLFISDKKIIVVTSQDIEENNKLIISKKAGHYTYLHDKYDLIVTNAFNADIETSELCIIYFRDFYKEPKMKTLSIKFIDKEILLSNEIDKIYNSDSIDSLRYVKPSIDLQESSAPLEIPSNGDINAQGEFNRTALHLASEAGDWDKVKLLLDRGANIEIQDKFGYTPIFLATKSGKWSIVKLLLDKDANIDAQDKEGHTPLHFAAQEDNLDMIQFLLDRGANIEVQDERAWTPILYAAQSGKWGVVKLLIGNGAKFNNEITYQGTPLHFAAQGGNLDIAQFLLDEGAVIESQDKDDKKPLHLAVEAGRLNVVKLLLNRGANVNVTDMNDKTPLDLATKGDMIELLKKAQLDQGLSINAQDGNLNRVKDLIAQGANLETKDNNDNTPLHNACSNGHLKVVEYLIEKGASLKAKNKDGKIPLDLAAQKGHTDIVQTIKQVQSDLNEKLLSAVKDGDLNKVEDLVSQGTSLEVKDSNGNTLLHYASQNDHLRVVEYLIEKGASLKAKNKDGEIPLDLAVKKNYINIRKFLEKTQLDLDKELLTAVQDGDLNKVEGLANRGASLDTKDNNDWTLLHFAALSNKFDIVKFLFDKNANIEAKDVYGDTPLHVAAQYSNNLEIVEFLLDKNANSINYVNNNGSTPLHVAVQGDKPSTVKFLLNRGANIAVKDKNHKTPLNLADTKDYTDIVQIIKQVQSDLDEKLLIAVQGGDLNKIRSLVSQNANVSTTDMYSWTSLHWAAFKDHLEIAKFLIEKGADINATDKGPYGKKPIHVAAENNNKDIIEFFLSEKAGINDTDKRGYTPLHYAAFRGRLEVVKFLIEEHANSTFKYNNGSTLSCNTSSSNYLHTTKCLIGEKNILEIRDNSGRLPLHCAASNGKLDIVKYFIDEEKIDANITDNSGWTPLHWASGNGHLDVVKYLIEKGANFEIKDKDKKTPLDVAADQKNDDVVKYLGQAQLNKELLNAVQGGDLNKVKNLISKGASVNARDKDGKAPLHYASQFNLVDMVQFLISKYANINSKDNNGRTPLDVAVDKKHNDIIEYLKQVQLDLDSKLLIAAQGDDLDKIKDLVSQGASLDAKGSDGRTPIFCAAQKSKWDVVKFLIDQGAKFNEMTDQGTLLHFIVQRGNLNMVQFLLNKGANVNAQDKNGWTPVFWAIQNNNLNMVKLLLDNGADIKAKDNEGWTPLRWASWNGHLDVEEYLVGKGTDISVKDKDGKTQLGLNEQLLTAVRGGNLNKVKDLVRQGASLDAQDSNNGWTPILYAAQGSKWDVVKFLIAQGAKFNNEITYQGTPLHSAIQEGNLDMVQFLLNQGASVESENDSNSKPLHLAVKAGKLDVIGLLLDRNANVDTTDMYSQTPLHLAVEVDRLDVVKLLLNRGASVDVIDIYGQTPLSLATKRNSTDVARYLEQARLNKGLLIAAGKGDLDKVKNSIRQGANVNTQDKKGWSPIFWAIQKNNLNIVKLLVNYGADIKIKDNEGWTPLHWAVQLDLSDVVKYLIEKGADVSALTVDDRTPLDLALQGNCANIVEILQQAKLDLEKGKPTQRKLLSIDSRNYPEIAASSGVRPSSWINGLFGWMKAKGNLLTSSIVSPVSRWFIDDQDINVTLKQAHKRQMPIKFNPKIAESSAFEKIKSMIFGRDEVSQNMVGFYDEVLGELNKENLKRVEDLCKEIKANFEPYKDSDIYTCRTNVAKLIKDKCDVDNNYLNNLCTNKLLESMKKQINNVKRYNMQKQSEYMRSLCNQDGNIILLTYLLGWYNKIKSKDKEDIYHEIRELAYKVLKKTEICKMISQAMSQGNMSMHISISEDDIYTSALGEAVVYTYLTKNQIYDILLSSLENLSEIKLNEGKRQESNIIKEFANKYGSSEIVSISEDDPLYLIVQKIIDYYDLGKESRYKESYTTPKAQNTSRNSYSTDYANLSSVLYNSSIRPSELINDDLNLSLNIPATELNDVSVIKNITQVMHL